MIDAVQVIDESDGARLCRAFGFTLGVLLTVPLIPFIFVREYRRDDRRELEIHRT